MNSVRSIILATLLAGMTVPAAGFELNNVTYKVKDLGTVVFSHKDHLEQKSIRNNCKACHKEGSKKLGRHTMADMDNGKSCGSCHNGKKAFAVADCQKCHPVRQVNLKTKDIGAITFNHKAHATRQRCESCHAQIYQAGPNKPVGMAAMEKGKSCGSCHNKQAAIGLDKCSACHPTKAFTYSIKGAAPVAFSHDFHLGLYTCQDCHNKIFRIAKKRSTATMTAMETGKSCGSCHDGKQAFSVKGNCASCHKVA